MPLLSVAGCATGSACLFSPPLTLGGMPLAQGLPKTALLASGRLQHHRPMHLDDGRM
jgi:hypothetical protein